MSNGGDGGPLKHSRNLSEWMKRYGIVEATGLDLAPRIQPVVLLDTLERNAVSASPIEYSLNIRHTPDAGLRPVVRLTAGPKGCRVLAAGCDSFGYATVGQPYGSVVNVLPATVYPSVPNAPAPLSVVDRYSSGDPSNGLTLGVNTAGITFPNGGLQLPPGGVFQISRNQTGTIGLFGIVFVEPD